MGAVQRSRFQNVFPRYGYIECAELDTNVFFVPSHVACEWTPGGFASLLDRLKKGDRVQFQAARQAERSGCRWLASQVRYSGRNSISCCSLSSAKAGKLQFNTSAPIQIWYLEPLSCHVFFQ